VFFNRYGVGFADFHARFAAKAFVLVNGSGFSVLHFIHLNRAYINAFAAAYAFVRINMYSPAHDTPPGCFAGCAAPDYVFSRIPADGVSIFTL
jgi:cystathionine beta-lyase family protein involved in aluminum resistance